MKITILSPSNTMLRNDAGLRQALNASIITYLICLWINNEWFHKFTSGHFRLSDAIMVFHSTACLLPLLVWSNGKVCLHQWTYVSSRGAFLRYNFLRSHTPAVFDSNMGCLAMFQMLRWFVNMDESIVKWSQSRSVFRVHLIWRFVSQKHTTCIKGHG